MKLHTVFITYNRLELTKRAIESYLETVSVPFTFIVVDNNSSDGTQEWLLDEAFPFGCWERNADGSQQCYISTLAENKYPGYAANEGWSEAPSDATHLHRSDNDFIFLPGWCEEVKRRFSKNKRLGQLGLRTGEEELHNAHNVGGNCVIRRELWDAGLRYDERPWPKIKVPGFTEDSYFSPAVAEMGWEWARVQTPCIQSISVEDASDPYYRKTWKDRGINL